MKTVVIIFLSFLSISVVAQDRVEDIEVDSICNLYLKFFKSRIGKKRFEKKSELSKIWIKKKSGEFISMEFDEVDSLEKHYAFGQCFAVSNLYHLYVKSGFNGYRFIYDGKKKLRLYYFNNVDYLYDKQGELTAKIIQKKGKKVYFPVANNEVPSMIELDSLYKNRLYYDQDSIQKVEVVYSYDYKVSRNGNGFYPFILACPKTELVKVKWDMADGGYAIAYSFNNATKLGLDVQMIEGSSMNIFLYQVFNKDGLLEWELNYSLLEGDGVEVKDKHFIFGSKKVNQLNQKIDLVKEGQFMYLRPAADLRGSFYTEKKIVLDMWTMELKVK